MPINIVGKGTFTFALLYFIISSERPQRSFLFLFFSSCPSTFESSGVLPHHPARPEKYDTASQFSSLMTLKPMWRPFGFRGFPNKGCLEINTKLKPTHIREVPSSPDTSIYFLCIWPCTMWRHLCGWPFMSARYFLLYFIRFRGWYVFCFYFRLNCLRSFNSWFK